MLLGQNIRKAKQGATVVTPRPRNDYSKVTKSRQANNGC